MTGGRVALGVDEDSLYWKASCCKRGVPGKLAFPSCITMLSTRWIRLYDRNKVLRLLVPGRGALQTRSGIDTKTVLRNASSVQESNEVTQGMTGDLHAILFHLER